MVHLRQWRSFLPWLPEDLNKLSSENNMEFFALAALQLFHLTDWRGRRKGGFGVPMGANILAEKDGQPWFVRVPETVLKPVPPAELPPPPPDELRRLEKGLPVHEKEVVTNTIDLSEAQFIRPWDQPRVLLDEYNRIYARLKGRKGLNAPALWRAEFPDVPEVLVCRWFIGRYPTPPDLALLVAAHGARYTASLGNLSTFREELAGARKRSKSLS